MTNWGNLSQEIIKSFYLQTKTYVGKVIASNDNYMDCLLDYYRQAWTVPKEFKGNSTAMGFVPEYLIFEIVKQYLEKKYGFAFRSEIRSRTSSHIETLYFVDESKEPNRLLVQGLRIGANEHGFHQTDCQHDITYQVKYGNWQVKAIIEVKGFFETTSLRGDIIKLESAEKKYKKTEDCLFCFLGFIKSENLSSPSKEVIRSFVRQNNHFFISPGEINPDIGNSSLKDLLDNL